MSRLAGATSGKLREKSSVLSSRLKAGRVVDEITSAGRAFQTRVAMTGKARSQTDSYYGGSRTASLSMKLSDLKRQDARGPFFLADLRT